MGWGTQPVHLTGWGTQPLRRAPSLCDPPDCLVVMKYAGNRRGEVPSPDGLGNPTGTPDGLGKPNPYEECRVCVTLVIVSL